MEKEVMTESGEIACIGLYPKKWAGTAALATTAAQLIEIEGGLEAEQVQEVFVPNATEVMSVGSRMAGPLFVEESYAMELGEWVQYYWSFASHPGFVCVVDHEWEQRVPEDFVAYAAGNTTSVEFITQLGNRTIYRAVSPKEPPLSEELSDFCSRHGVLAHLRTAIEYLKASFPSVERLNLQLEQDPETGDEWILLNFDVSENVDDVLCRYDYYTDLLVKSVPWSERNRIRVAYNIM